MSKIKRSWHSNRIVSADFHHPESGLHHGIVPTWAVHICIHPWEMSLIQSYVDHYTERLRRARHPIDGPSIGTGM